MDYLPVVVGRKRPFLGDLSSSVGSSRSVCPEGRLLALVNGRGAVSVYSLTGDSSGECTVSSDTFTRSDMEPQQSTSVALCIYISL